MQIGNGEIRFTRITDGAEGKQQSESDQNDWYRFADSSLEEVNR